jgi:hypothetical protein
VWVRRRGGPFANRIPLNNVHLFSNGTQFANLTLQNNKGLVRSAEDAQLVAVDIDRESALLELFGVGEAGDVGVEIGEVEQ